MRLIDAKRLEANIKEAFLENPVVMGMMLRWIRKQPTADVAPVVRCKDCEYSDDEISYLCCTHGVCADCEVPPNFYCAEGKRKDGDDDAKAD